VKPTKSLAPALVDGAYESDELPFVLEAEAPVSQRQMLMGTRPET